MLEGSGNETRLNAIFGEPQTTGIKKSELQKQEKQEELGEERSGLSLEEERTLLDVLSCTDPHSLEQYNEIRELFGKLKIFFIGKSTQEYVAVNDSAFGFKADMMVDKNTRYSWLNGKDIHITEEIFNNAMSKCVEMCNIEMRKKEDTNYKNLPDPIYSIISGTISRFQKRLAEWFEDTKN